jgi:hypothetical protein
MREEFSPDCPPHLLNDRAHDYANDRNEPLPPAHNYAGDRDRPRQRWNSWTSILQKA